MVDLNGKGVVGRLPENDTVREDENVGFCGVELPWTSDAEDGDEDTDGVEREEEGIEDDDVDDEEKEGRREKCWCLSDGTNTGASTAFSKRDSLMSNEGDEEEVKGEIDDDDVDDVDDRLKVEEVGVEIED